jgi:hypothetical protein
MLISDGGGSGTFDREKRVSRSYDLVRQIIDREFGSIVSLGSARAGQIPHLRLENRKSQSHND